MIISILHSDIEVAHANISMHSVLMTNNFEKNKADLLKTSYVPQANF